jgi:hypothetical protein
MDTYAVLAKVEDSLTSAARIAGDDGAVEQAAEALIGGLRPAMRQAVLELAEQAATEVGAQLTASTVEVVLNDGEPTLVVRPDTSEPTFASDELEARMTVRLPTNLKSQLEEAADRAGDSVNSFVIKTLASGSSRGRKGRRIRETLET